MAIDFSFFKGKKDNVVWSPVLEWVKGTGVVKHFAWKAFVRSEGQVSSMPIFFLYADINKVDKSLSFSLFANIMKDSMGKGGKLIDRQVIKEDWNTASISSVISELSQKYNIKEGMTEPLLSELLIEFLDPTLSENKTNASEVAFESSGYQIEKTHFLKMKETRLLNNDDNSIVSISLVRMRFFSKTTRKMEDVYQTKYFLLDFITGHPTTKKIEINNVSFSLAKVNSEYNQLIAEFKEDGFEEKNNAMLYYKKEDWLKREKEANMAFALIEEKYNEKTMNDLEYFQKSDTLKEEKAKNSSKKIIKKSQSNWYTGAIPDPKSIERYVGTPSVDATQLKSVFVGVDDAIVLVNRFDSSLLLNVGFIFNFSNQGAYGVYLPSLDDKIKREKIKDILKKQGCKINENPDGSFYAYHENKTPDEIQKEIDREYGSLSSQGGTVFGINMNKVLMASQADARDIGATDNEDIKDIITMHLGATIVHEAIHAKGSHSEGPSEAGEAKFLEWVLTIINQKRMEKYKSKGIEQDFNPLQINHGVRRSSNISWLKKAYSIPSGAQFSGDVPGEEAGFLLEKLNQMGMGFKYAKPGPVEAMLQNFREDIDSPRRHMSIERQMRVKEEMEQKVFEIDKDFAHTEDMLQKDRDEFISYKSIEKLLEERRPSPLMSKENVKADANGMKKMATFFGWMNNLDLTMGDRVISKYDSQDDLNFDWTEIAELPRYNSDGQSYVYCEPRLNSPELWEQMIAERPSSFINPARRFASTDAANSPDIDGISDVKKVINILKIVSYHIENKKFLGTRFIVSRDMIDVLKKFFNQFKNINIYVDSENSKTHNDEEVLPGWIYRKSIPEDKIRMVEDFVCKRDNSYEAKEIYEYVVGLSSIKKEIIEKIISEAKGVCREFGIKDVYLVGGFPRSIVMKESFSDVHDLDFSSAWSDQCLKFGGMLADALGVTETEVFHRTMTLSWEWMGIKCDFKGGFAPVDIREMLRKNNITSSSLHFDIYSRDFTINMLIYDIINNKIYDVCKQSVADIKSKTLKTYFKEVDTILKQNPIIILRALKYMIRYGFKPESELEKAMIANKELLFSGKYSNERLLIGLCELFEEGRSKAEKLIAKYGLEKILEVKGEAPNANTN